MDLLVAEFSAEAEPLTSTCSVPIGRTLMTRRQRSRQRVRAANGVRQPEPLFLNAQQDRPANVTWCASTKASAGGACGRSLAVVYAARSCRDLPSLAAISARTAATRALARSRPIRI